MRYVNNEVVAIIERVLHFQSSQNTAMPHLSLKFLAQMRALSTRSAQAILNSNRSSSIQSFIDCASSWISSLQSTIADKVDCFVWIIQIIILIIDHRSSGARDSTMLNKNLSSFSSIWLRIFGLNAPY